MPAEEFAYVPVGERFLLMRRRPGQARWEAMYFVAYEFEARECLDVCIRADAAGEAARRAKPARQA